MAKIITTANRKGGVGKSTVTYNLAFTYALDGKRVLLVDLDSQANLSLLCGVSPVSIEDFKAGAVATINPRIDLLPGSKDFASLEDEIQRMTNRMAFFKKIVLPTLSDYDYILIDTSPSLSILNLNAFVVSDMVHVIINQDSFSLAGLMEMKTILTEIKEEFNKLLDYKITVNGAKQGRKFTAAMDEYLKNEKLYTGIAIPDRQHVVDSNAKREPAIAHNDIYEPLKQLAGVI